ncbi:MAG TPA: hypothetical protein VKU41_31625 [Polyangiaceae bacterium]|nr:hypothetical protein [Polyangiaceae bacterium]
MQHRLSTAAIVLAGIAVFGCRAKILDLGNTIGDGGFTSAAATLASAPRCTNPPPTLPADASAPPPMAQSAAALLGVWTGYLEAYTFQTGSDAVVITFTAAPDGTLVATAAFGKGQAPPPPVNGNEGYPADVYPPGTDTPSSLEFPFEGFPYTATELSFDGARLALGVVRNELWRDWCTLQTSYSSESGAACGCLPNWGGMGSTDLGGMCFLDDPATGEAVPVACFVFDACAFYAVCSCTSAGCSVDMTQPNARLDVRLTSGHLDGSISGFTTSPIAVHLTQGP